MRDVGIITASLDQSRPRREPSGSNAPHAGEIEIRSIEGVVEGGRGEVGIGTGAVGV